ncbi:hypothetical protein F4Y59_11605 [Candidatus Poribacteria bacterium]|nr:hypothetical protein [Candidatus Poribacteria bacterium]
MIACTLMDIYPENDSTTASTLVDISAKVIVRFESEAEGEVLIDPEKKIAVAAEGHVFNTSIEYRIAAEALQRYIEKGVDGLLAMNGQYTVIVYDCHQHKLIALTDKLSTCSLFYEQVGSSTNRLSLSNTLSWFKKTREMPHLDPTYMIAYLGGHPRPVGSTPFRDVQRLPLATGLTFESRKLRMKLWQYWWPFPQKTSLPENICTRRLNEVMTEVTHEFMTYYRDSIGVFLSGGLDSSYVYAVAADMGHRPPIAFHYSFQISECNEVEWAQDVVNHYGGKLVRMDFGKLWTFQGFPDMPTTEEPVSSTFQSKEIIDHATTSRGIRLMLNGLGGDDFFDAPEHILFADMLTWRHPIRTLKRLNNRVKNGEHSYMDLMRHAPTRPQRIVPIPPEYLSHSQLTHASPLRGFRAKTWVQKRMEFCLRTARPYVGIPAPYLHHSPLFDPRILEVAAALPMQNLHSNESTKIVLREAAQSYLPERVVKRKKENPHNPIVLQGLHREWPAIIPYFQQNARLYDVGLVDRDKFISALQSFRGGNTKFTPFIVKAFACEAWLAKQ